MVHLSEKTLADILLTLINAGSKMTAEEIADKIDRGKDYTQSHLRFLANEGEVKIEKEDKKRDKGPTLPDVWGTKEERQEGKQEVGPSPFRYSLSHNFDWDKEYHPKVVRALELLPEKGKRAISDFLPFNIDEPKIELDYLLSDPPIEKTLTFKSDRLDDEEELSRLLNDFRHGCFPTDFRPDFDFTTTVLEGDGIEVSPKNGSIDSDISDIFATMDDFYDGVRDPQSHPLFALPGAYDDPGGAIVDPRRESVKEPTYEVGGTKYRSHYAYWSTKILEAIEEVAPERGRKIRDSLSSIKSPLWSLASRLRKVISSSGVRAVGLWKKLCHSVVSIGILLLLLIAVLVGAGLIPFSSTSTYILLIIGMISLTLIREPVSKGLEKLRKGAIGFDASPDDLRLLESEFSKIEVEKKRKLKAENYVPVELLKLKEEPKVRRWIVERLKEHSNYFMPACFWKLIGFKEANKEMEEDEPPLVNPYEARIKSPPYTSYYGGLAKSFDAARKALEKEKEKVAYSYIHIGVKNHFFKEGFFDAWKLIRKTKELENIKIFKPLKSALSRKIDGKRVNLADVYKDLSNGKLKSIESAIESIERGDYDYESSQGPSSLEGIWGPVSRLK